MDLARRFEDAGVAAIVYTDIDRDGAMQGPNVAATAALARAVAIPVIASGGIASLDDLRALKASGAPLDGAISGRALYEGAIDLGAGGAAAGGVRRRAMSFETWAAFVAASAVLLVIPGPTILLVVSYALGRGWKVAAPVATGVALGDLTAMTLSMLGVGALLAGLGGAVHGGEVGRARAISSGSG